MALCKDDAVRTLNRLEYDVVTYPRPDIRPLDIKIEVNRQFSRFGLLPQLWLSTSPLPNVEQSGAPNVSTVRSSKLHGKVGVQALADVLGRLSAKLAGESTKSMQSVAEEPITLSCTHSKPGNYISHGTIAYENTASRHFLDESVRLYVVTKVIASGKLKVIVGDEGSAEATAAAADLTNSISATAGMETARASGNTISYERSPSAVFGFKSAEDVSHGGWIIELPSRAGGKFLGPSQEGKAQPDAVRVPGTRLAIGEHTN